MTRVWYEPSPGLRFAGIDLGEGSMPQWRRVLLSGHYWQWKSSKGQHRPFANGEQCAVVPTRLFPRECTVAHLDGADAPEAPMGDDATSTDDETLDLLLGDVQSAMCWQDSCVARRRIKDGARLLTRQRDDAKAEVSRLAKLLNTPELQDFRDAVVREAAHQRERWGDEHDKAKAPADWFWLVGFLAGKALAAQLAGKLDKARHHTISTAAALANWHATIPPSKGTA